MYHVAFYVPESHLEIVKKSLFEAGAGKIGNYDSCSFEYEGIGQFRALEGSAPFIGQVNKLEKIKEIKVEMVCAEEFLSAAISALKISHPYETPAYYVTKTVNI